jgi:gamma-glutamyl-gamma-aminobutyrate hydrolase PuuD
MDYYTKYKKYKSKYLDLKKIVGKGKPNVVIEKHEYEEIKNQLVAIIDGLIVEPPQNEILLSYENGIGTFKNTDDCNTYNLEIISIPVENRETDEKYPYNKEYMWEYVSSYQYGKKPDVVIEKREYKEKRSELVAKIDGLIVESPHNHKLISYKDEVGSFKNKGDCNIYNFKIISIPVEERETDEKYPYNREYMWEYA